MTEPEHRLAEAADYLLIEDNTALAAYVAVLETCPVVAVDIESNSLHHYTERTSLIQVTGRDTDGVCHHGVVDPLAAGIDVPMLGPILANPEVVIIFHGADFDVASLKRDYGFTINNIYDTMIASRGVGRPRFGLADLVKGYFGVALDKKYQKHDWGSRPLSQEALDYAHLDTRYLPEIMDRLTELVVEKQREDMVAEECVLLENRSWGPKAPKEEQFLNLKGINRLPEDTLKILRAVHGWREKVAEQRDWPPFKIMGTDMLIGIASAAPTTASELEQVSGRRNRMVRRHGPDILDAVAEGVASEVPIPKPRKDAKGRRYTRDDEVLFNQLRTWRNAQAEREGLEPSMVVGNQVLKEISALRPADAADLAQVLGIRQWQIKRYAGILIESVAAFVANG